MNIAYLINFNGERQKIKAVDYKANIHCGRLICPYCNEKVEWTDGRAIRLDGKTREKCFKHHHGTKKIECENYCSDISQYQNIHPYEKIGLPLYILKEFNSFSLNIGLYGISEVALNEALQSNLSVTILINKEVINTKKIDYVNFVPEIMNYIRVNCCSDRYGVTCSSGNVPYDISKKWYKDVNGIGENGAIFEYNLHGGKKVKSSDGLRTNTDYYLLLKFHINPNLFTSITFSRMGEIIFSYLSKPAVYKINIKEINSESMSFCKNFGMTLSYLKPQLIALWPPCKINDQEVIFINKEKRFFILKADDKEEKNVFSQVSRGKIDSQMVSQNKLILKSRGGSEDFLSIGNSLSPFICAALSGSLKSDLGAIELTSKSISDSVLQISSSAKVKIIRWKGNVPNNVIIVKQKSINIEKPKINERIEILHGLDELLTIEKEKKLVDSNVKKIDEYLSEVINFDNENLIPVPSSLKWIMLELRLYPKTYYKLKKIIINGKISCKTLIILKKQCLRNRGV